MRILTAAVVSAFVAISCGGEDQGASDTAPVSGFDPGTGPVVGTGMGSGGSATGQLPPGTTPPGAAPNCPTYDGDFLPSVQAPVCSKCHGTDPKLPNWGVYATASAACSLIGSQVASGNMPPRSSGLSLTPAQRTLVADWVRIGCPKTQSDTPASCRAAPSPSPSPPGTSTTPLPPAYPPPNGADAGAAPTPPGVTSTLSINRAEWRSETTTLRLEGTTSDYMATLTAEFDGRRHAITNAGGQFRAELDAPTYPPIVTVTSSSGASDTASVQAH